MNEPQDKGPNPYTAYALVAFVCAAACFGIAVIAFGKFTYVTDVAMWSIAAMILAPAVLGVGVSYFIYRTAASKQSSQVAMAAVNQEGHFRPGDLASERIQ